MIEITSKLFGFLARSSQISFMCSAKRICSAKRSSSECTGASGALMSVDERVRPADQAALILDRIVEQCRQHHRCQFDRDVLHPVECLAAWQPIQHHVAARSRIRVSIFASVTGFTVELTSRRWSSCSGGSMRNRSWCAPCPLARR